MLYESVPAWIASATVATVGLTTAGTVPPRIRRLSGWVVAVSVLGAPLLTASALRSASVSANGSVGTVLPESATTGPALVFVHGSWSSRVVARLTSAGMRRDSVETALRRNDMCAADRYARWRAADPPQRPADPPPLDLDPLPGTPSRLRRVRMTPGNEIWVDPEAAWDEECERERAADGAGTLDLEPLLWRAPPLAGEPLVTARDMGPVVNERVRRTLGSRSARVYLPGNGRTTAVTLDYAEGMRQLWGADDDAPRER
jgi:hypothetical protein